VTFLNSTCSQVTTTVDWTVAIEVLYIRYYIIGGVTKQLKLELDYAKMIVNKQEDLTWLR